MAQRYSAGRGLCDGEEAAPASQVPADSCELCSQTPLSAPDMCLLESGDSDSFGMLAVLCSERQEEPFQHALQLCQLHLGIGAIHKNMQMEFSWAEPRKAMFDQIRQSLRDAGGQWSELAPALNILRASAVGLTAYGLGYGTVSLQRAACIALVLEKMRRDEIVAPEAGELSLCLGAVQKAPRFRLEPLRVDADLQGDDFVKKEGISDERPRGGPRMRVGASQPTERWQREYLRRQEGRRCRADQKRRRGCSRRSRSRNGRRRRTNRSCIMQSRSRSCRRRRTKRRCGSNRGPRALAEQERLPEHERSRGRQRVRRIASPTSPELTSITIADKRLDENSPLETVTSCFGRLGLMACNDCVKTETGERDRKGHAAGGLLDTQKEVLMALGKGNSRFDPAKANFEPGSTQGRLTNIDVRDLRFSHKNVSRTFRLGAHEGDEVTKLTDQLLRGTVTASHLPPLVVVKVEEKFWTVHGNRRLKALKEYARQSRRLEVQAPCILHDSDDGLHHSMFAKLLLHLDSETDGRYAAFRGRRTGRGCK